MFCLKNKKLTTQIRLLVRILFSLSQRITGTILFIIDSRVRPGQIGSWLQEKGPAGPNTNYRFELFPCLLSSGFCSLGFSLIIFSSFLFFRSFVKNDSLGNFDFNRQRHLDFSSNFVG